MHVATRGVRQPRMHIATALLLAHATVASALAFASPLRAHALRLRPGDDLPASLLRFGEESAISAATVLSCVGSLSECRLRLAGASEIITLTEELEVVSLVGTLSGAPPAFHLHASLSRADGSVVGGHIKGPAIVRTTAEVVIGELSALDFSREFDEETGYEELKIRRRDDGE